MPTILIEATTAAAESEPFKVTRGFSPRGLDSFGLTGSEEIVIHRKKSDGTWAALTSEGYNMTATTPFTGITASGTYKLVKPITDQPAGAGID